MTHLGREIGLDSAQTNVTDPGRYMPNSSPEKKGMDDYERDNHANGAPDQHVTTGLVPLWITRNRAFRAPAHSDVRYAPIATEELQRRDWSRGHKQTFRSEKVADLRLVGQFQLGG